jgi:hypothetical protein
MLTAIELENFRSFGQRVRIPLAPITLVLGQNSAGKSSILHALTVLKQTRESREVGAPLLPRAEGGIIDLGSYNELLFEHDTRQTLHFMLEMGLGAEEPRVMGRLHWMVARQLGLRSLGVDLSFRRDTPAGEVFLQGFELRSPSVDGALARFATRPMTAEERRKMPGLPWDPIRGRRLARGQRALVAECREVSHAREIWRPLYEAWSQHRQDVASALEKLRAPGGSQHVFAYDPETEMLDEETKVDRRSSIAQAVQFYSREFTFEEFVRRMTRGWSKALVFMDGFIPSRGVSSELQLPEVQLITGDPYWVRVAGGPSLRLPVFDVPAITTVAGRVLDQTLDALFPMGPWRRPPQRWYIFTGTSPRDVGYQGEMLPDLLFRKPDLLQEANEWLRRLEIGYTIKVRPVGENISDLFEMRLVDRFRSDKLDVALPDVGFGVSQVLPFIVQCLAATNRLISIEQPEVHIHPRLQADLGELVAASIRKPYGHSFLIETHSEHLVLRIQKLVRDRTLKPEDVSVLFVSRGHQGSSIQTIRLDSDGDFVDEWPGGFFPERLRELR